MITSAHSSDGAATLREKAALPDYAAQACAAIGRIADAPDTPQACIALKEAATRLGADGAYFVTFLSDDATLSTYRSLDACDPRWSSEYARNAWFMDDPWLQHAMRSCEPVRASELVHEKPRERAVSEAAEALGFRSAVIVPAPTIAGRARVGVLCLGSRTPGYFDDDGYLVLRILARSLAMELNHWWHRRIRAELMARARVTEEDLQLLRFEQQGQPSKVIAAALGIEPRTVDCRFQRLNKKLRMPNRRASVRLAELYGLI